MRAPIAFIYGSCVFAAGLHDPWAAFALEPSTYAWLSVEERRARMLSLLAALEALRADVQILRVSGAWPLEEYESELAQELATPAARGGARAYLAAQRHALARTAPEQVRVFLLVSLRPPQRDLASFLSQAAGEHPREWWRRLCDLLAGRERRLLSGRQLERVRALAERAHACVADFLPARPARTVELQWLVRRAFCRGLGEPLVDGLHEPAALVFECNGEAVLAPLEGDVMRWTDSCVEQRGRHLEIESELGRGWQALLAMGALPERVVFPSPRAELMFAPVESLPFGIDVALTARYLDNELAVRLARRRIQDADQIVRAESDGDQGASDLGLERSREARDLLAYLHSASRPPLLRSTVAIAVAAASAQELERRIERVRRAYGEVQLHRPVGDQLQLFLQTLPGQRARVRGYEDMLTVEQVAAMMPTAAHVAGSASGFYLGHTLSHSRRPVLLNLREGSDSDRNTTILSVGALGSGKTTLAQKLQYEAFLQGARVVDCDPKEDHRFHLLADVAPHVERVPLRPDPSLRGLLDPLRIAPAHLRQDAAVSFLRDLLPARVEPAWETAIVAAVDRVVARAHEPTCTEVVHALREGGAAARAAGEALAVYARAGLTQLGFADARVRLPEFGARQVTYLPIRDLPGPDPGTSRREYSQVERVGVQIVRLLAMFAMRLLGAERDRLKLFAFDEGWRLLGDPVGRALLASLQRMGRSDLAVPLVSTQLVTDALLGERDSLDSLLGATFVFGMRSESEAARALELLGLDGADAALRRELLALDAGRCLFRDHAGRIEAIQVEVVPSLLRALSTTPRRA